MCKNTLLRATCYSCDADIETGYVFCQACGRLRWSVFGIHFKRWEVLLVIVCLCLMGLVGLAMNIPNRAIAQIEPTLQPRPTKFYATSTSRPLQLASTRTALPTKTKIPTKAVIPTRTKVKNKTATISNEVYFVNLRRSPGYKNKDDNKDSIAEVPRGAIVTIISGPEKADGLIWWYVEWKNNKGWIAEKTGSGKAILVFNH